MTMRARTTPLSAAWTLVAWMEEHGRQPRELDCCPANGLMSHMTYLRVFHGSSFSAIVSYAVDLVRATTVGVSGLKMRQCIGRRANGVECDNVFLDQGSHIRQCGECRRRLREHPVPETAVYSLPPFLMQQHDREWEDEESG